VLEARALVRLYKDLLDERTGWLQRVHASLFHLGAPDLDVGAMSAAGRERLAAAELSPATRTAVDVALRQVDRLTADMTRVREQICVFLWPELGAHFSPGLAVARFDEAGSHNRPRLLKLSAPLRPMTR